MARGGQRDLIILRSTAVDSQPVARSHVVGSSVASMTSVNARPPSELPMRMRRSVRCGRRGSPEIGDHDVPIPKQLLGFLKPSAASSQLLERGLGREQLMNFVRHNRGVAEGSTERPSAESRAKTTLRVAQRASAAGRRGESDSGTE
jgi:hypothetical protein